MLTIKNKIFLALNYISGLLYTLGCAPNLFMRLNMRILVIVFVPFQVYLAWKLKFLDLDLDLVINRVKKNHDI